MAKGRKLTASRNERFFGYGSYSTGNSVTAGISELGEDDVWSAGGSNTIDRDDDPINNMHGVWRSTESNGSYGITTNKTPRQGKREEQLIGGLSLALEDSGNNAMSKRIVVQKYRSSQQQESVDPSSGGRQMASSAPMNVPDWRKIIRLDAMDSSEDRSDERDSDRMVPPHEYLQAREYSRSGKMAATSVFEGVGRTLKGRDLRRVRDAVWSQTGFDG